MATTVPTWTDGVAVQPIALVARGSTPLRSTLDLRGKPGARLALFIGRLDETALDVPVAVRVRPILSALTPDMSLPGASEFSASSETAAAVSGVCAAAGNNAAVSTLTLNAPKTFAVVNLEQPILFICDNPAAPTTASEFVRQAFPTSTTAKLLDAPTISAHNSTSHTVSDKSNNWRPWIEGGCVYEIVFDYAAATTGGSVVVGAYAQTLDALTTT